MKGTLRIGTPQPVGFSQIPLGAWFIHKKDAAETAVRPYLKAGARCAFNGVSRFEHPPFFTDEPEYFIVNISREPEWVLA